MRELPFGRNRSAAWTAIEQLGLPPIEFDFVRWLFAQAWPEYHDGKPAGPQPVEITRPAIAQALGWSRRAARRVVQTLAAWGIVSEERFSRGLRLRFDWRVVFGERRAWTPPIAAPRSTATSRATDAVSGVGVDSRLRGNDESSRLRGNDEIGRLRQLLQQAYSLIGQLTATLAELVDRPADQPSDRPRSTMIDHDRPADPGRSVEDQPTEDLSVVVAESCSFPGKLKENQQQQTVSAQPVIDRASDRPLVDQSREVVNHSGRPFTVDLSETKQQYREVRYCQQVFEALERTAWVTADDQRDWYAFWAWLVRAMERGLAAPWGVIHKRVREGTWRDFDPRYYEIGDRCLRRITEGSHGEADSAGPVRGGAVAGVSEASVGRRAEPAGGALHSAGVEDCRAASLVAAHRD